MTTDARSVEREIVRLSDELSIELQVLEESGAVPSAKVYPAYVAPGEAAPTIGSGIGGLDLANADVEALCFLVMMEASKSAQEDLKAIMAQVKAINDAKARQREQLQRLQDALPAASEQPKPPASTRAPDLDALIQVLLAVYAIDVDRQGKMALDDLDSMSELGETESLRLQMAMDRMSKMMSTLSNLLKKISDTANQITQNLK